MQKKELLEQIGKLNVKIATSNKELEKLELEYKKKRLELKKYKNERIGLQLKLQEIEDNKKTISDTEIKRRQRRTVEKYCNDPNNEYYTQEKTYSNLEDSYMNYMRKNVVPYND